MASSTLSPTACHKKATLTAAKPISPPARLALPAAIAVSPPAAARQRQNPKAPRAGGAAAAYAVACPAAVKRSGPAATKPFATTASD